MSSLADKIEHILLFADSHRGRDFDASFIISVKNWIDSDKPVTSAQIRAIENIYRKFHIREYMLNN